jgi:hypothetical protein
MIKQICNRCEKTFNAPGALCPACQRVDAQHAAERAAWNELIRVLDEKRAAIYAVDEPLRALQLSTAKCAVANAAIWGDATPRDVLEALCAVCHFTPHHARTLGAARYLARVGHEQHFSVPSASKPGEFRTVKIYANSYGPAYCDCPAMGDCWHIRAARGVAALLEAEAESRALNSLLQVDDVTQAALDTDDDLSDAAPEPLGAACDNLAPQFYAQRFSNGVR